MKRNADLHGNAPDKCANALLLIDVINDLEFDSGAKLLKYALPMARKLAEFKQRAKRAGVPVIYVNDNFGKWQTNFKKLLAHCRQDGVRGQPVVELLQPEDDDYFVLKPKHSGFFSTTLDTLLRYLGAETLILTGVATDICVLFTANDAYMRDYGLYVPSDCVATQSDEENKHALEYIARTLKAVTRPSSEIIFADKNTIQAPARAHN